MKNLRLQDLHAGIFGTITGMTDAIRPVLGWGLHQILDEGVERGDDLPSDVWNELAAICNDLGLEIRSVSEDSIKAKVKAMTENVVWEYAQRIRRLQESIRPHQGRGGWGGGR
jgi:hypothetical protein